MTNAASLKLMEKIANVAPFKKNPTMIIAKKEKRKKKCFLN